MIEPGTDNLVVLRKVLRLNPYLTNVRQPSTHIGFATMRLSAIPNGIPLAVKFFPAHLAFDASIAYSSDRQQCIQSCNNSSVRLYNVPITIWIREGNAITWRKAVGLRQSRDNIPEIPCVFFPFRKCFIYTRTGLSVGLRGNESVARHPSRSISVIYQ